eukprot:1643364-Ditylum_brightwellii.AAC.1
MYHVPPPPTTNQQTERDICAELEAARKERESFCAAYEEMAGQMMQTELAKDHKNNEIYDDSLPDPVKSDNNNGYVSTGESYVWLEDELHHLVELGSVLEAFQLEE